MVPLARCRELLGAEAEVLDDGSLRQLRDALYVLAGGVVEARIQEAPSSLMLATARNTAPTVDWEAVEERAAIIEFDGEVPRDVAERMAICDRLAKDSTDE